MNISVVIPLLNEDESIPELAEWIARVMKENNFTYEIIFIDDGSKDRSWEIIESLAEVNPSIKGIKFRRNYGKSAALNVGFQASEGDVVITMDADLQDSPNEIPDLYSLIKKENFDLISGWKQKRYDPMTKTIPSKFFNWTTRKVSGIDNLHDFNCGLKAYRSEVVKNIEVYGEMHRYIPLLARWAGYRRIGEKVVEHRARKYGVTKFGWERFINGFLDLLSITFVTKFGKKPMHIFGLLGTLSFIMGFFIALYLAVSKYLFHVFNMTDRPLFYFGLLAMIIGVQLFSAGFLAEMMARNSPDRNIYLIDKTIGKSELNQQTI
ncbi:MAG: glycosyltransferase family 2 protein [Bacteroidia bacterium]